MCNILWYLMVFASSFKPLQDSALGFPALPFQRIFTSLYPNCDKHTWIIARGSATGYRIVSVFEALYSLHSDTLYSTEKSGLQTGYTPILSYHNTVYKIFAFILKQFILLKIDACIKDKTRNTLSLASSNAHSFHMWKFKIFNHLFIVLML